MLEDSCDWAVTQSRHGDFRRRLKVLVQSELARVAAERPAACDQKELSCPRSNCPTCRL